MISNLEHSIYNTIRYFDIFDMPVTAVQIWRSLVVAPANSAGRSSQPQEMHLRWGGTQLPSLAEMVEALRTSDWLRERVDTHWGYYFLAGRESLVSARLARHALAQRKWKIVRGVVKWLAPLPFVHMIAGSGSLALDNTRPESDLDLFVVVGAGRIWTARLFLLTAAQLTGRRRKHWDRLAPDKVCLNHYVSEKRLAVPTDIRNLYTAVAYTHLVPLAGLSMYDRFMRANGTWIRRFLMYPEAPLLSHAYTVRTRPWVRLTKRVIEQILLEPIGNVVERAAESIQRRTIARHTVPGRLGRVAVSNAELAFHPDSRVPAVLSRFAQDPGQAALL